MLNSKEPKTIAEVQQMVDHFCRSLKENQDPGNTVTFESRREQDAEGYWCYMVAATWHLDGNVLQLAFGLREGTTLSLQEYLNSMVEKLKQESAAMQRVPKKPGAVLAASHSPTISVLVERLASEKPVPNKPGRPENPAKWRAKAWKTKKGKR